MKKLPLYILIIVSISIFYSCKDHLVGPPYQRTTLEYEWDIDTLLNPYGYGFVPKSIWGSSPEDVWAVGFNLAGQGEMFHYDGSKWKRVTPDLGFNYDLASVYGFSKDEVYIVGSELIRTPELRTKSIILKFNGKTWSLEKLLPGRALLFIHGTDSNNMWACGNYGTLYKKKGSEWVKLPFDEKYDLGPIWVSPTNTTYMSYDYDDYPVTKDTTLFYFSKLEGNNWSILDSCRLVSVDGYRRGYRFGEDGMIGFSDNQIYSVGEDGVFKFDGTNNNMNHWANYSHNAIGRNQNGYMFAVGDHGTINYNLNNEWKKINDFSNYTVAFYSVMVFENDVFIGAYDRGNGYVIRGKLKAPEIKQP